MAGGGARAEPEDELSSRSSSGCDSEEWETSEEGITKSKGKLLPDGFLDPLPPQKSSNLPRFSGMKEQSGRQRYRCQNTQQEMPPSIAALGDSHRGNVVDEVGILLASTHIQMAREWPVECPRMVYVLHRFGLDYIRHLQFIRLDQHLITALVERWCPMTNTFHLPIGEMTITLQDVQLLLGIRVDGPAVIGPPVVGAGLRWDSWADCSLELLGSHPEPNVTYHDPMDTEIQATFRTSGSHGESMIPLRWLRWTFYRDSYDGMNPTMFVQHVRAYILFMIGCFLLPDTSRSHVTLQYLPLLEDLDIFGQMSIGSSVLGHLYRELYLATSPGRLYIAGCLPLLQVWSWERLHVGRPTLRVPLPRELLDKPLSCRWAEDRIREVPAGNMMIYRDAFDSLRLSQVTMIPYTEDIIASLPQICHIGTDVWTARIPLISWKRVEWHLADRVMRQFGGLQSTDIHPIERTFRRIDGRGRANVDWTHQYRTFIAIWNNRRSYITQVHVPMGSGNQELTTYLRWYRSWASIYLLRPSTQPPETIYPRSPGERLMVEYYVRSREIVQPFIGDHEHSMQAMQQALNDIAELADRVERSVYIDYGAFDTHDDIQSSAQRPRRRQTHTQGSRKSTSKASRRSAANIVGADDFTT